MASDMTPTPAEPALTEAELRLLNSYYRKQYAAGGFATDVRRLLAEHAAQQQQIAAGWIDKEDVNPDEIFRAMHMAAVCLLTTENGDG